MENVYNTKCASIDELVDEVLRGEHKKDTLPNSSLEFSGERQAMFFSNLRRNMQSEMAGVVMSNSTQLDELYLLKKWGVCNEE